MSERTSDDKRRLKRGDVGDTVIHRMRSARYRINRQNGTHKISK